jgi:hypothetical protein
MPTVVQFRRGTTNQNDSFTGADGEFSVDTNKYTIRVHDGVTSGGNELLRKDLTNQQVLIDTGVGTSPTILDTFDATDFRSAEYFITVTDTVNNRYCVQTLNVVHNGTTAVVAVYGVVASPPDAPTLMTFSVTCSSGIVSLSGTGNSSNNTVKMLRRLAPV